ncbi:hypothetical protein HpCHN48_14380 [Helicobacter pylori]
MKKIRFKNPTQLAKNLKQKTKIRSKSSNTRIKKTRFKSNKNQSRPIRHTKQNQRKKSNKPNGS